MTEALINNHAFIWSVADLLRGDYKQSEYGKVILPLTVDKLLLDQFEESWVARPELTDQARNNSLDNFRLVLDRKFPQTIVTRVDANEKIYKKILDVKAREV